MQAASQPVNQVAKAPPPKGGINLIEILKDYVENMLLECQGRKALILDQATLVIISMVYSRTQILQKEVFFIDIIDNIPTEKLMHLKAIFFTRCTEENVSKICAQLRDPIFSSYNLYFSNTVQPERIQKFAEADQHNVVNQVQEVFADF
jgi:vacuolar protein sorting-associated protein 45